MSLATRLKTTGTNLIEEFGNNVVVSTVTNNNVYNPQTGSMGAATTVTYNKKAYIASPTTSELSKSGLAETVWGKVSFVATMVEDSETSLLTNSWKIDNTPVMKVIKTTAQDTTIIVKVYCGM